LEVKILSYTDLIERADKKSRSTSIAIKIRDMMKNLRLSTNEESSRRWIWELLQNAKDVSYSDLKTKVQVELNLNSNYLKFSHNGKPFTAENITFLVGQVSSKDQIPYSGERIKETGKFGTGFLTTHLLSEVVKIEGVLKEYDEPYKQFHLTLDRSGRDIDSIISSVESSLEELKKVELSEDMENYCSDNFNTSFIYTLDSLGVEVAKRGLEDLINLIPYTLIFVPNIESVSVIHEGVTYFLDPRIEQIAANISIYTIVKSTRSVQYEHKLIVAQNYDVSVAFEIEYIDDNIYLKEFSDGIPKLFCDFPLIGTEKFAFPFVLNCSRFNPNEPRNGVYLTDKLDELVLENKEIVRNGLELYSDLLDFAAANNWKNMHHFLANTNSIINVDWLLNDWLKSDVTTPIKNKVLNTKIIDTENGYRVAIKENNKIQVLFPDHRDKNIRVGLFELCKSVDLSKLPLKNEIENWNKVIWSDYKKLDFEVLTFMIEKCGNIECLGRKLSDGINPFSWLNSYYQLLNMENGFIEEIVSDKYSVIPNQNGIFVKRSEVFIDSNIDEALKDVLKLVGEDCREYLLSKYIYTGEGVKYYKKDSNFIISRINELLSNCKPPVKFEASQKLISMFAIDDEFPKERQLIYDFSKEILQDRIGEKIVISSWSDKIWEKADSIIIRNVISEIAGFKNVETLKTVINFNSTDSCINWLNGFVEFISKEYNSLLDDERYAILPNQNGDFCTKDTLYLDDDSADEEIKSITSKLGYNFREVLLDKGIYLSLSKRTITLSDIAEKLTTLVRGKWNDLLKDNTTKQALRDLYSWFNENEYKAKEFFSDLYKYKHRFLEDSEVIESIDKARKYDEIMSKFKIDDYDDLENILESVSEHNSDSNKEKVVLSDELLAQLGISSKEQLELALNKGVLSKHFIHLSEGTSYKFEFVQELIDYAIEKVFKQLKEDDAYDFSEIIELDKTIFLIKKHRMDMYLIVRPSDYGQIIFYYDSEKDVLDYEKDWEIWAASKCDAPQKITFGKILKITGINKIPLKRIR
jgi:hypothetical protein